MNKSFEKDALKLPWDKKGITLLGVAIAVCFWQETKSGFSKVRCLLVDLMGV